MARIYLTGRVTDWDNPFQWHDELRDEWPEHEFVNPYDLNDFELGDDGIYERPHEVVEPALEELEQCDGMLVWWGDDEFLVGSTMEMKHAFDHDVPVVVYYDGWRDNLSPWVLHMTRGNFDSLEQATKVMLTFAQGTDTFNFIHDDG